MNVPNWVSLILGISVFILICMMFVDSLIKASVFRRLGFKKSKNDLNKITFKKIDFDYTAITGTDNNQNQENLISEAIKHIDTEDTPQMKEIDYYD